MHDNPVRICDTMTMHTSLIPKNQLPVANTLDANELFLVKISAQKL